MKKLIAFMLLLVSGAEISAQPTRANGDYDRESIEHTEIGWMKMIQFKEPAKPYSQGGWNYTAKQMAVTERLALWMQQTITPKGLLGEQGRSVLAPVRPEQPGSRSYNYNEAEKNNKYALPNTYGAFAKFYFLLKKTATKKFWSQGDYFYSWYVMANNLELFTKQVVNLSSPEVFYFTIPRYEIGMKGSLDKEWLDRSAKYGNFNNSPNLKNYEHYIIPPKSVDFNTKPYYVVIMTKDNKPLPFEQVTFGEFISRLEKQLPVMYEIAMNGGVQVDNLLANARRGIQLLKEKYKNNLKDYFYFSESTSSIDILDLAGIEAGKDVYWIRTKALSDEGHNYTSINIPLWKLRKGVKEACATGEPQWIICRLEGGITPENAGEIHLMESFVDRFNYVYVYDYFFGKTKPAQPYRPAR